MITCVSDETQKPDYSIIIPAFNEEAILPRSLKILKSQIGALKWRSEIIVVDNNSTDRTAEVAMEAGARVVFEPHNQIARARNTGGRAAKGEWLIFIDADTYPGDELLKATLDRLSSQKYYGGGAIMTFDIRVDWLSQRMAGFWNWLARNMNWSAGGYFFCVKEAFTKTGGFRETVYAGEEVDFSQNLKRWGKARNMKFAFLNEHQAITSARKLQWHATSKLIAMLFVMCCFPWLRRSRSACWFWYKRPDNGEAVKL